MEGGCTGELLLIADDVGMVQFLHDIDLLVDVLLQEGLLLYVQFADDLHGIQHISRLCLTLDLLCRARTTSPKAPFPMDLMIS